MPELVELRTEPDAIDAPWITAVLDADGQQRPVRSIVHEPVGTGLMARSHRFRLEHNDGSASSLVVKFPSADVTVRALGASSYAKEVGFYRDLAATVHGGLARCLHVDGSPGGDDFVLVMEDLAPRRPGNQLTGCSLAHAEVAVRNLAAIHASTWGRRSLTELPWIDSSSVSGLGALMGVVHDAFADRFAGRLDDATGAVLSRFAERVDVWLEREPSTRALVHGDYRLDNLLFGADDVVTVDWQTADYRSPMRDLAYFCGNSITTDQRRVTERGVVDAYLDELTKGGVEGYDAEQAWDELRHGMFQGPLVTMLGAFAAGRSDRSEAMFATMADRSAAQILDHGALDVLD